MKKDGETVSPAQEQFIFQTFPFIHRIIYRRLGVKHRGALDDLKQRVFLKLWDWKRQHSEKDLSDEEWQKMAHVVAHNEVTDFFRKKDNGNILFSQMEEDAREEVLSIESSETLAGNSAAEIRSLLKLIWKLSQTLSLRQKYSYFLQFRRFIVEFIVYGCCTIKELAAYFEVTEEELSRIIDELPLPDEKIGKLVAVKEPATPGENIPSHKIWEARSKAKAKLAKRLKEYIRNE